MPQIEVHDLRQYAVLWAYTGRQDRHGLQILAEPIEIRVRWTLNNNQVIDPQGNTVAESKTIIADRDIPVMSVLRLGRLDDLPDPPDNLHQTIDSETTPSLKATQTRYEYKLMRFGNNLPTVQS